MVSYFHVAKHMKSETIEGFMKLDQHDIFEAKLFDDDDDDRINSKWCDSSSTIRAN